MRNFIKEYFVFSRQEQKGIALLLALLLLLLLTLFILRFYTPITKTDFSEFDSQIKAFEAEQAADTTLPEKQNRNSKAFYKKKWQKLPNRYPTKESKIYPDRNGKIVEKPNPVIQPVEINSADSIALVRLKGIGPAFSKRIIKYRSLLGGFYKKEQLLEIYGLDSIFFNQIEKQIVIDASLIKKVDLNTLKAEELKNHPYFRYKLVKAIINFREQHGDFQNVSQIKQCDLVNEELYLKIAPYLSIKATD